MRSLLLPLSLLLHSISSAHPTPLRAAETVGDPDLADRAREIHQQGRFEEAIALLKKRLAEDGKDRECRLLLGRFFDYEGEPEEAVRVWESGLTGEKEDLPLLMAVGQIRARQGDDGPEVTYRRGTSTSGPVKDEKGAETFKKDRYRLAARAYEKAMKLRPDLLEPGQELVEVLLALEESEAAVKLLADLRKTFPGESRLLLRWAQALSGMGKEEEAFEKFQAVLRESPRCAEAHGALAEHYQERGEAKQAAESRRRAEFYDWMPGFAALEYSSERYSSFRLLSESPEADETEEADEAKLEEKARAIEKRRAAEVERLIGDGSPASLSMLAAFCFHHDHHGEIENHAYQGLVSKDKALAIQLLEGLLREGQNLCTMRSAAFALAELKAPVTFELVSNALPQDVRPYFYMDAAGALAVLGDPRAVGPLVKVLNPAHHLAEPKDDRMQTTLGRNWARWRAALALGSFDTGESRQALEEGTANDQIALACRAALYRLTREEKHLAPVAKALKSTTGLAESIVGRYLAEMDDPRAKALAEEHAKLEEEEQARRRREEKN